MKAAIYAILGRKISFMVTPKVYEDRTHISYFYPHLGMIVLLSAAIIVGFVKLFNQFETSLLFNIIWCIIFLLMMQAFRYFQENSSEVSIYYHDIFASK
jgi:fucose permease